MKFEVNKFLTLTALLAGAATVVVACSSSDSKKPSGGAGEGGSAGSSTGAGSGGKASAGESAGGAAEGGVAESGAGAPSAMGGAAEGGAAEGGAPGDGACIADLVGEGGAAAEGSTPCDIWSAVGVPDCSQEFGNFATQLCNDLLFEVRPAVLTVFNTCVTGVGDVCNQAGVQACGDALVGKGCAQDGTAAACTFISSKCTDGTIDNCPALLDLTTPDAQSGAQDCMDPAGGTYDGVFDGNCEDRLVACLHFKI